MDWLLFLFLVLIGLWIAEKIPGIGMLVKPLLDSAVKLTHVLAQSILEYLVWFIKTVFRSHKVFVYHLFHRRQGINAKESVLEKKKKT